MSMSPYFTAINSPLEKHSVMLMALPDLQAARFGPDFATGMLMAEYGITSRWTAGVMAEGQKISGMPATWGGMRINTYVHPFGDDRLLNLTLYGEYEDLNGAALYKMEVAGFGPEDLTEPLAVARRTSVRTFEQRVIVYHDWSRLNATFNFIRETPLQAPHGSDYGYAIGVFLKPSQMSAPMSPTMSPTMSASPTMDAPMSPTMPGMPGMAATPAPSMSRFGYGVEMFGSLGDHERFGLQRSTQQHYIGPVFMVALSPHWSVRVEPAFGLSRVSDRFLFRTGVAYVFGPRGPKPNEKGQAPM